MRQGSADLFERVERRASRHARMLSGIVSLTRFFMGWERPVLAHQCHPRRYSELWLVKRRPCFFDGMLIGFRDEGCLQR